MDRDPPAPSPAGVGGGGEAGGASRVPLGSGRGGGGCVGWLADGLDSRRGWVGRGSRVKAGGGTRVSYSLPQVGLVSQCAAKN